MIQNYTSLFLKSIFPEIVFTSFDVFAIYLGDAKYTELYQLPKTPCFCVVVDANGAYDVQNRRYANIKQGRAKFERGLEKIRLHDNYIADYVFDFEGSKHVILLAMEESAKEKARTFMSGKYSEIFTSSELKKLKLDKDSLAYQIMYKTPERKQNFQDFLNIYYRTNITFDEDDDRELLEKPLSISEILNGAYGFSFDE